MDSVFSTLGFVIFGFSVSFYALLVQSHGEVGPNVLSSKSFQMPPPPTPPALPPPPPPLLKSPPRHRFQPPPPHHAFPQHQRGNLPNMKKSPPSLSHLRRDFPAHQMNAGKKVGILFLGIAAIMQIGVFGFLIFKRRQLLKLKDRYETCS